MRSLFPTEAQWECVYRGLSTNISDSQVAKAEVKFRGIEIYDLPGDSSSEWCLDRYSFTLPGGNVTNPAGPTSGSLRVKRGGTAFRLGAAPDHSTYDIFRVVLSPAG